MTTRIIEKPWGREIWIAVTESYALKIIEVNAGSRSSLQYHEKKHEHVYLDAGRLRMETEDDDGSMIERIIEPGDVVENPPRRKHRVEALLDSRLIEVSTPDLDDVVRLEDDYGR